MIAFDEYEDVKSVGARQAIEEYFSGHPPRLQTDRSKWFIGQTSTHESVSLARPARFASLMIAAGCDAKALSTYMGHSSITITLDRYGHLMAGNEEQAAGLLDVRPKPSGASDF